MEVFLDFISASLVFDAIESKTPRPAIHQTTGLLEVMCRHTQTFGKSILPLLGTRRHRAARNSRITNVFAMSIKNAPTSGKASVYVNLERYPKIVLRRLVRRLFAADAAKSGGTDEFGFDATKIGLLGARSERRPCRHARYDPRMVSHSRPFKKRAKP
jgi:hypothetical protein